MFDKKKEYNSYIKPIVEKLIRECNARKIPVIVSVAVKDDGKKTEYERDVITAAGCEIRLSQDRFPKILNMLAGIPCEYMEDEELVLTYETADDDWKGDEDKL